MMIDFRLEASATGKTPEEAIYQAFFSGFAHHDDTMAALLGGVPLALGTVGLGLRRPLGISIVGGLILCRFLLSSLPGRLSLSSIALGVSTSTR